VALELRIDGSYIWQESSSPLGFSGMAARMALEFHGVTDNVLLSTPSMKHRCSGTAATVTSDSMCRPAVKPESTCRKNCRNWYFPNSPGNRKTHNYKLVGKGRKLLKSASS